MSSKNPLPGIRINKWLAEQGVLSRRAADAAIEAGRVQVDGVAAALGAQVFANSVVTLDGAPVQLRTSGIVVVAFHKPLGVECTSNPKVRNNIISLVQIPGERLVHVGRLDKASEGLILLTNTGDLVNQILRVEHGHEKEYQVDFTTSPSQDQIKTMAQGGLVIGDSKTLPCRIEKIGTFKVRIVLQQGLNRQIRRMAESVGLVVGRLLRTRIMHITLGALKSGEHRFLEKNELATLLKSCKLDHLSSDLHPKKGGSS